MVLTDSIPQRSDKSSCGLGEAAYLLDQQLAVEEQVVDRDDDAKQDHQFAHVKLRLRIL